MNFSILGLDVGAIETQNNFVLKSANRHLIDIEKHLVVQGNYVNFVRRLCLFKSVSPDQSSIVL